jgi:hypothetical protein
MTLNEVEWVKMKNDNAKSKMFWSKTEELPVFYTLIFKF